MDTTSIACNNLTRNTTLRIENKVNNRTTQLSSCKGNKLSNMTTTAPQEKIRDTAPLSNYAKFHLAFKGKSFLNTKTGKTVSKNDMYWRLPIRATKQMIDGTFMPPNYTLVDSPGWANGKQLTICKSVNPLKF